MVTCLVAKYYVEVLLTYNYPMLVSSIMPINDDITSDVFVWKDVKEVSLLYKTKQNPQKQHPDNIFSIAAGMANKSHSLTHQIKACKATIFCVQETNFKKKGRNMNNE